MTEQIQSFYNILFNDLKQYILAHSKYNPYIFKEQPEDKLFPLVVVKEAPRSLSYTTLNYTDALYYFGLDINVYALTTNGISGVTVCEELSQIIEKYFTEKYRMNITLSPNAPNVDESVNRTVIKVNCTLDTKYKDNMIIYPR